MADDRRARRPARAHDAAGRTSIRTRRRRPSRTSASSGRPATGGDRCADRRSPLRRRIAAASACPRARRRARDADALPCPRPGRRRSRPRPRSTPSRPRGAPLDRDADVAAVLDDRSPDPASARSCARRSRRPGRADRRPTRPTAAPPCRGRPQSLRQQELVCLTTGHVNCPRYLRGAVGRSPRRRPPVVRERPGDVAGDARVAGRAGLRVDRVGRLRPRPGRRARASPTAGPSPSRRPVAAVSPATVASVRTVVGAELRPSPAAHGHADARPPTPTPTPAPTPRRPTPTARRRPRARRRRPTATSCCSPARARRAAGSTPSDAGDNLFSIANYFGVSAGQHLRAQPVAASRAAAGQELRLPPPRAEAPTDRGRTPSTPGRPLGPAQTPCGPDRSTSPGASPGTGRRDRRR